MKNLLAALVAAFFILAAATFWTVALADCGWITYYKATGNKTACGDKYTGEEMIAAHRTLPCGTRLTVRDSATGKSVRVTVRDRGPAKWTGNSLDLSYRAARHLNMVQRGRIKGCW